MTEQNSYHYHPAVYQPVPPEEDEIDLVELVRVIWNQKWFVVAITFLFICAGGLYSFLQPPVYEVETLLAPTQSEKKGPSIPGGLGGLANMAGVNLGSSGGKLDEALATLKSRKFLTAYIADKDLLPILFSEKWDSETEQWDVEKKDQIPSLVDGYKSFEKNILNVSQSEETGLVTLSITWRNGTQAATWANGLVKRLNRKIREEEIDRLNRKVAFLRQQVEQTNISGVRQALFSIMENQLQSKTIAKTQKQYVFRVIDPAVPPEKDDTANTSLKLILALSGVTGVFLGIFGVFFRQFIRNNFLASSESEDTS